MQAGEQGRPVAREDGLHHELVLDTTYFFVVSMASAKGTSHWVIQSGHSPVAGRRHADSIIS